LCLGQCSQGEVIEFEKSHLRFVKLKTFEMHLMYFVYLLIFSVVLS